MKTTTTHIKVKHRHNSDAGFSISIATEDGDLKSHLLKVLAKTDHLLELSEKLFGEICDANETNGGRYEALIDAIASTTAYRQAPWSENTHIAHYGLKT
jgi:hypothetical protein